MPAVEEEEEEEFGFDIPLFTTRRSLKAANILLSLPPPQQTLCEVSGAETSEKCD